MPSPEERRLLQKLADGTLDGPVGDEREYRVYRSVYCGKQIRCGVPVSYRQDEPSGLPVGGRQEPAPLNREEELFDTDERKLEFLQRFGWLMDDEDVRIYSAKYKPDRKEGR